MSEADKKKRQVTMFSDRDIAVVQVERERCERTTHKKKYHHVHVEIEHKATGKRLCGYYGHIYKSGDFIFWPDDDDFGSNTLTKSKWRVVGIIEDETPD